jgi:hypothetical protein
MVTNCVSIIVCCAQACSLLKGDTATCLDFEQHIIPHRALQALSAQSLTSPLHASLRGGVWIELPQLLCYMIDLVAGVPPMFVRVS